MLLEKTISIKQACFLALSLSISVFFPIIALSQNLVPNPDFESYTSCPTGLNFPGPPEIQCQPWTSGSWATPDFFHACASPGDVGVPTNFFIYQPALSGEAYCGMYTYAVSGGDYREYLQAPLLEPLEADVAYYVSFNVSLSNKCCGQRQLGAYFSSVPPAFNWNDPILVTPQVESDGPYLSDTTQWMQVEGCFRAVGGETYITIGNFHTNIQDPLDPNCTVNNYAYYYIDDVYVSEILPGGLALELGDPVSACYTYTIDPDITGVQFLWNTGATTPTLTVTESGLYVLTITDECNSGVDSIEVEIIDAPPVELTPDEITLCSGETLTFNLDPDFGTYTWDDGTISSEFTISTPGEYIVTLDDGCDQTTDDIIVYYLNPPVLDDIGGDTTLCEGAQIMINLDPGLGDYVWQDGSTSTMYTIANPGIYSVTVSNSCGMETAQINVQAGSQAIVNLGLDTVTLCTGQLLTFGLDSTLGTYVWQDGSTAHNYSITMPGNYSVTLTHACGSSHDSITVLTLTTPFFDLGDTLRACPGDTLILTPGGFAGEYTWQDGTDSTVYTVTLSGVYAATVTNACGTDDGDVVVLYAPDLVPPALGPDFDLCPGGSFTLNAQNPLADVLWQDLSTADTLLVSAPGIYDVQVTNGCDTLKDTVMVGFNALPPVVDLPDQYTLCQGDTITLDPIIAGVSFLWNDQSTGAQLQVTAPGQYSLTVTSACGADADTVNVLDGGSAPFVDLGPDVQGCVGDVIVIEPFSTGVTTWLWYDGSADDQFMASSSGELSVAVSNGCGTSYDTMQVDFMPVTPPVDLGSDLSLCPGETHVLTVTLTGVNIEWSDGSTGSTYVVNSNDTVVYASVTNGCGVQSDTVFVNAQADVTMLDLGPDLSLCPGEQILIDPGIDGVQYEWQDGSVGETYTVIQSGTIILTITNACSSSSDTLLINESTQSPTVDLGPDLMGCSGDLFIIPSGITGVTYVWQDGSTDQQFVAANTGWVHVTVTNACGSGTDSVFVDLEHWPPDADLGADTTICEGTPLVLQSNASPGTSVLWHDGSQLPFIEVFPPQWVSVEISNTCGSSADTLFVGLNTDVPVLDLPSSALWCPGDTIVLDVGQPFPAQYSWSTGEATALIVVDQEGLYAVDVVTICATASAQIEVIRADSCNGEVNMYVPNVFSPNGDGVNDVFTISVGADVRLISVEGSIYDRWGNLVYANEADSFTWDGHFSDALVMPGVYVYKIIVSYSISGRSKRTLLRGDVTLVK